MGYLPQQPLKSRTIRDKYKAKRRKQLLAALGCGGLAIIFAAITTATVLLARSCSRPPGPAPIISRVQKHRSDTDANIARQIGRNTFRSAPLFSAVDEQRLYVAGNSQRGGREESAYAIDQLAAYRFGEDEPAWELERIYEEAGGLEAVGGSVCLYAQRLADPPYAELVALAGESGELAWQERIDLAERLQVLAAGDTLVANYHLSDGYRLVGYQGSTGTRTALGMKVPLRGLAADNTDAALPLDMELYSWDGQVGYTYYNVAGIVDVESGELLIEHALDTYIYDLAYSAKKRRAYALARGETLDSYVVWELAPGGAPLEVYRFLSSGESTLLLASGEYVAIAHHVAAGQAAGSVKLAVLKYEHPTPLVEYVLDYPGEPGDIARLPAGGGQQPAFLFALNGGLDESGWPLGRARLYLVKPEAAEPVRMLANLKQPVLYCWQLKQDCLLVTRGGPVYSYLHGAQQLYLLARLRYELALPYASTAGQTLTLASAPEEHWQGQPNRPLSMTMFK